MFFQAITNTVVKNSAIKKGGERGIRTPGPVSGTQHFQCCGILATTNYVYSGYVNV
ncbi:hypothetical protein Pan153_41560 [Gimesia panareensis]|uniref:Uncharacterized protein n=1 Tax=Gimesia panareensis TaxID=2527978 RepID=A0A518FT45_9PLAN|nr:hypothetical protein Pan153_41560 [Gimesia panareensis]